MLEKHDFIISRAAASPAHAGAGPSVIPAQAGIHAEPAPPARHGSPLSRGRHAFAVVPDDWTVLRLDEGADAAAVAIPPGKLVVPLAVWLSQKALLSGRGQLGVWIAAGERPEVLAGEFHEFALVAVDFPIFSDGRGYSIAYNLRMRLGWQGELRAIGDVLRDQLFSMQRVGFDAFATRKDRSIHDALLGLAVFSETYQASVDNPVPLWRRRIAA